MPSTLHEFIHITPSRLAEWATDHDVGTLFPCTESAEGALEQLVIANPHLARHLEALYLAHHTHTTTEQTNAIHHA